MAHETHATHHKTEPKAEVKAETVKAAPPRSISGVLYSAEPPNVVLSKDNATDGKPGTSYELAKTVTVTVNGVETVLDDLKRNDKLTLEGEPVSKIEAIR